MPHADTIILLLIAILNVYTAWKSRQTNIAAERTEINTNSMREQLVIATGKAMKAEGRAEMKDEMEGAKSPPPPA